MGIYRMVFARVKTQMPERPKQNKYCIHFT
jgi:hypothetical protein